MFSQESRLKTRQVDIATIIGPYLKFWDSLNFLDLLYLLVLNRKKNHSSRGLWG